MESNFYEIGCSAYGIFVATLRSGFCPLLGTVHFSKLYLLRNFYPKSGNDFLKFFQLNLSDKLFCADNIFTHYFFFPVLIPFNNKIISAFACEDGHVFKLYQFQQGEK